MIEAQQLMTIIALVISSVAALVAILQLRRGTTADHDAGHDMLVRIDARTADTDRKVGEQATDIKSISDKIDGIRERLVIVEQSTKSAHHRIDEIQRDMHVGGTD